MDATHTPEQSEADAVAKVAKLIAETRVCMLTTVDANGYFVSRPMAVLEVKFDGVLWFVTNENTRKVAQVRKGEKVHAAFASSSAWVSVAGNAQIIRDAAKARELWGPGVSAWFPEGPDSPDIVLVKVQAHGAEYGDTPGAATSSLLSFVKAKMTGAPYKVENDAVTL